jgi:hypothetical protein
MVFPYLCTLGGEGSAFSGYLDIDPGCLESVAPVTWLHISKSIIHQNS